MLKISNTFKIFLILGFLMTLACASNLDDDDECPICDFIVGVAVAACESNSTCNHIMKTITLVLIITVVVFSTVSFCMMSSNERSNCLRECWNNRPSAGRVARRGIAGGAGYYTGRTIFSSN